MASKVLLQTVPKPSHRRWGPLQMVFSNTSSFGNCKLCSPTPSAARTISINERHYHRWHQLSHHRLRRPPPSISPLLCPPMRTFHISSIISSTPESFHGISLPKGKQTNHPEIENVGFVDGVKVKEAEVVKSDNEKEKTRQMIAEYTRAELWSHSVSSDEKSKDADDVDFLAKNGASGNNEEKFLSMSPYERRVFLLKKEEEILASQYGKGLSTPSTVEEVMGYSQRCMNIAELHYQLGQMEQSQEFFMDALKQLLELDQSNIADSISFHIHFATAKIMHSLGAIHARCGEYSEAFRWYDESMKRKRDIFGVVSDPPTAENCEISSKYCSSASEGYHFELGMTYNGLAALEIMKANGNSPDWQKAMRLFKQAEKNYIYHYYNSSLNDTTIISSLGSDAIRKMQPHHAQALINVRSNMGELLLQQDDIDNALNQIRSALELAKADVENLLDEEEKGGIYIPSIHEPSPAERKNAVVDLQLKIADCLSYKEDYDLAAEAYERALHLHIGFRRWNRSTESTKKYLNQLSDLPVSTSTNVEVDISNTTSLEAALRNSLADCLAHIGQPDISLKHYEASLAIKRRIGGDHHNEVAHTLMSMGALLGSSGDTSGALNCFKEALYIYRTNLEEESGVHREKAVGGEEVTFYGEEHESVNQLQGYVQNAMKNIAVIESALMKNSVGQK